ncbi:class I SAM-dependent rRNA methyltransferase [Pelagibaculum spongiae]|uniref:class I SAM-dependent rRNA methyltransferase n=1 Tax=Pelagibaculum spongiae TaxID=2080658 RepID=UPI001F4DF9D7|nr:class I SAM-dependent rRNA methyltransferase [Pelagibaculum spongiae]
MEDFSILKLKKNEQRRLQSGHCWIYANEIDSKATPVSSFKPGEQVLVEGSDGKKIGYALMSPTHLICARLVSRDLKRHLDKSLLVHRLKVALSLRESIFDQPCYRLVYGDSDGLPGLVIDRYFDHYVVQINHPGMEIRLEELKQAMEKVLKPESVLLRNDGKSRKAEGMESYIKPLIGEPPELVDLVENGVKFQAPISTGQKTGWFYDHRINRAAVMQHAKGKRVLDVFSYIGGWAVQAAVGGASEVWAIDSSEKALDQLLANGELNGVGDKLTALQGDAFEALKELKNQNERFDLIVLDPPALIPRRRDFKAGLSAYRRLNELAIRLLSKDGMLVSCSCSMHLPKDQLTDQLRGAAVHLDRNLQIIGFGGQGPDHPILPAVPETDYLKATFCRVTQR